MNRRHACGTRTPLCFDCLRDIKGPRHEVAGGFLVCQKCAEARFAIRMVPVSAGRPVDATADRFTTEGDNFPAWLKGEVPYDPDYRPYEEVEV
jgi:hypothetical protein